jgi:hypothetical protein
MVAMSRTVGWPRSPIWHHSGFRWFATTTSRRQTRQTICLSSCLLSYTWPTVIRTPRTQLNQGPTSEVALPLSTYLRGGVGLSQPAALLERARDLVRLPSFCQTPRDAPAQADACGALDIAMPRRVIVIDRLPQPEVAAPLGWSLSQSSRNALNDAIDAQVEARCGTPTSPPSCRLGYAPLGELRRYYGVR